MATDKTEPNLPLIAGITVLAIGTLIAVRLALGSYFISMHETEYNQKIGSFRSGLLAEVQQTSERQLRDGNIDQAMRRVSGTLTESRPSEIEPRAEALDNDLARAPMLGWTDTTFGALRAARTEARPPASAGHDEHGAHGAANEHGAEHPAPAATGEHGADHGSTAAPATGEGSTTAPANAEPGSTAAPAANAAHGASNTPAPTPAPAPTAPAAAPQYPTGVAPRPAARPAAPRTAAPATRRAATPGTGEGGTGEGAAPAQ